MERNRLRRRLRELARVHLLPSMLAQDVLIRANPAAYDREFTALETEIRGVSARLAARAE